MPFTTAQGTTFEFDGDEFQCTNIKVATANAAGGTSQMDVSTLDLAEGADRVFQENPLRDPNAPGSVGGVETTVTISFIGATAPVANTVGTLTTTAVSGEFKCTQAEVEYAVGDVVKGTATFVSEPGGS